MTKSKFTKDLVAVPGNDNWHMPTAEEIGISQEEYNRRCENLLNAIMGKKSGAPTAKKLKDDRD